MSINVIIAEMGLTKRKGAQCAHIAGQNHQSQVTSGLGA